MGECHVGEMPPQQFRPPLAISLQFLAAAWLLCLHLDGGGVSAQHGTDPSIVGALHATNADLVRFMGERWPVLQDIPMVRNALHVFDNVTAEANKAAYHSSMSSSPQLHETLWSSV